MSNPNSINLYGATTYFSKTSSSHPAPIQKIGGIQVDPESIQPVHSEPNLWQARTSDGAVVYFLQSAQNSERVLLKNPNTGRPINNEWEAIEVVKKDPSNQSLTAANNPRVVSDSPLPQNEWGEPIGPIFSSSSPLDQGGGRVAFQPPVPPGSTEAIRAALERTFRLPSYTTPPTPVPGQMGNLWRMGSNLLIILAPFLGSEGELNLAKMQGILPDYVTSRDLQMSGTALKKWNAHFLPPPSWTTDQIGRFIVGASGLYDLWSRKKISADQFTQAMNELVAQITNKNQVSHTSDQSKLDMGWWSQESPARVPTLLNRHDLLQGQIPGAGRLQAVLLGLSNSQSFLTDRVVKMKNGETIPVPGLGGDVRITRDQATPHGFALIVTVNDGQGGRVGYAPEFNTRTKTLDLPPELRAPSNRTPSHANGQATIPTGTVTHSPRSNPALLEGLKEERETLLTQFGSINQTIKALQDPTYVPSLKDIQTEHQQWETFQKEISTLQNRLNDFQTNVQKAFMEGTLDFEQYQALTEGIIESGLTLHQRKNDFLKAKAQGYNRALREIEQAIKHGRSLPYGNQLETYQKFSNLAQWYNTEGFVFEFNQNSRQVFMERVKRALTPSQTSGAPPSTEPPKPPSTPLTEHNLTEVNQQDPEVMKQRQLDRWRGAREEADRIIARERSRIELRPPTPQELNDILNSIENPLVRAMVEHTLSQKPLPQTGSISGDMSWRVYEQAVGQGKKWLESRGLDLENSTNQQIADAILQAMRESKFDTATAVNVWTYLDATGRAEEVNNALQQLAETIQNLINKIRNVKTSLTIEDTYTWSQLSQANKRQVLDNLTPQNLNRWATHLQINPPTLLDMVYGYNLREDRQTIDNDGIPKKIEIQGLLPGGPSETVRSQTYQGTHVKVDIYPTSHLSDSQLRTNIAAIQRANPMLYRGFPYEEMVHKLDGTDYLLVVSRQGVSQGGQPATTDRATTAVTVRNIEASDPVWNGLPKGKYAELNVVASGLTTSSPTDLKGLGSVAIKAGIDFARQLGVDGVILYNTDTTGGKSKAVYEREGFTPVKVRDPDTGQMVDKVVYVPIRTLDPRVQQEIISQAMLKKGAELGLQIVMPSEGQSLPSGSNPIQTLNLDGTLSNQSAYVVGNSLNSEQQQALLDAAGEQRDAISNNAVFPRYFFERRFPAPLINRINDTTTSLGSEDTYTWSQLSDDDKKQVLISLTQTGLNRLAQNLEVTVESLTKLRDAP